AMREGERRFLSAETLLAVSGGVQRGATELMHEQRRRAEWCWAMLSDHAWNGTDERNKRLNARLRRQWGEEFLALADEVEKLGWSRIAQSSDSPSVVLFNSLSFPRRDLVCVTGVEGAEIAGARAGRELLPVQRSSEGDRSAWCFVAPEVPGFGFRDVALVDVAAPDNPAARLRATESLLESPFYRLVPDAKTGGIASLVHVPSGRELISTDAGRALCQTVYFDGQEHLLGEVRVEPVAVGPVFARLRITGTATRMTVENLVTVYAELDRVDFEVRVTKQPCGDQERLCHMFPLMAKDATVRAASGGAVVRPRPQPVGDLLPGADTKRFAVQEFVNVACDDLSVTLVPHDAFVLRLDLDELAFEALGNDQNYREVLRDQDGQTQFRFRYSLRAVGGGYRGAEAIAFARSAATPLGWQVGRFAMPAGDMPRIEIDPARAVATCLKPPADPKVDGVVLRVWETAGQSEPLRIGVSGFARAVVADLLERDQSPLAIRDGAVEVNLRPHGYSAVRLAR
ncbi:MAG: hypothetical protein FJ276_36700, partial [Planctomycetes bacterium]|nr:hypothetical protein [Planctomycetota bacterium]